MPGTRHDESSQMEPQKLDEFGKLRLNHEDYTIGWLCALPIEQTAAIAMLDARHDTLRGLPHDHNTYTLGRIGNHNVVVACLPKGRYATIPATTAATWMLGTFPSIRFGLMVGIGAGLPCKVKLGDVVISCPTASYPGVVQWDLGKAEDGGKFTRTGALNNPPTTLLTALARLESQHALEGSVICHYLEEAGNRYPLIKTNCVPPPAPEITHIGPAHLTSSPDKWYSMFLAVWSMVLNAVSHFLGLSMLSPGGDEHKSAARSSAANQTVEALKIEEQREPHLHCGLIASGNQVVKDAVVRDSIDQNLGGNVLCIEMEAAGLMNDFPCIVIRGICDFADAQKAKAWQAYAATVAAGYSKELLSLVDPGEVKQVPEARLVMQTLQDIATQTKSIAQKQDQQIQTEEQRIQEERWQRFLDLLSPIVPLARHIEHQRQRVEGTGSWLLEDSAFNEWISLKTPNQTMFCYGDPGAGKTIISSLVIDKLKESAVRGSKTGVAYVYCDYLDQQTYTAVNIVGVILRQLLQRLTTVPLAVRQSCDKCLKKKDALNLSEVQRLFHSVSAEFDNIYLCLDALDELKDLSDIMQVMRDRPSNVRLFLTGRPYITAQVQIYLDDTRALSIEAHESDIVHFINSEIGGPRDAEPAAMDDELRTKIQQRICNSAEGIFLLPVLQVRAVLEQNLTIRDRKQSLETLPSTLGEAFAGYFTRIERQPPALADRAARIIAWVHLAFRPLRVDQLLCALSIRPGDVKFDREGVPVEKNLLICCHGLVTVDQETSTLRLVHFSLQEHLHWQTELFGTIIGEWHRHIAITCLTVAKFPRAFKSEPSQEKQMLRRFTDYAIYNWGHHLRHDKDTPESVFVLIEEYFNTGWERDCGRPYLSWPGFGIRTWGCESSGFQLSHVAVIFGLTRYLSYLISAGVSFNIKDCKGRTPLVLAAEIGQIETMQLLLAQPGVDVNSKDETGRTLLEHAVRIRGSTEMVKLLLAHPGVDINSWNSAWISPLYAAALLNSSEVIQPLVADPRTDVNLSSLGGTSSLSMTAENGYIEAAKMLLTHPNIDVNTQTKNGCTPLSILAAIDDRENFITLLLKHPNINVNSQDIYGGTPLTIAAEARAWKNVRLLLEQPGIEVNAQGERGKAPLLMAVWAGSKEIVELLLAQPKIDVNVRGNHGETPLHVASLVNEDVAAPGEITKLLLAHPDIDVNARDDEGNTPYAVMRSCDFREEGIKLLLAHPQIKVDLQEEFNETFRWATERYEEGKAELLYGIGAGMGTI